MVGSNSSFHIRSCDASSPVRTHALLKNCCLISSSSFTICAVDTYPQNEKINTLLTVVKTNLGKEAKRQATYKVVVMNKRLHLLCCKVTHSLAKELSCNNSDLIHTKIVLVGTNRLTDYCDNSHRPHTPLRTYLQCKF